MHYARQFVSENPPVDHYIDSYGSNFDDFLAKTDLVSELPFLPELARLEQIISEIFRKQHVKFSLDIDYSVELGLYKALEINYPVHELWTSILYNDQEINDQEDKKLLLIFRDGEDIIFHALDIKYQSILQSWQRTGKVDFRPNTMEKMLVNTFVGASL